MDPVTLVIDRQGFWPCGRPISKFKGAYPLGFLRRVKDLVGVDPDQMLHLFCGTLDFPFTSPETWVSGSSIPFEDEQFPMILADPPYSKELARSLYGRDYAGPYSFIPEAARVCAPGGYVGILSFLVYSVRWGLDGFDRVSTIAITTGPNMNIRVFCLFQKPIDWVAVPRNDIVQTVMPLSCPICYRMVISSRVDQPRTYCSNACRQKAYRIRSSTGTVRGGG